jgi:hypothetical protein
MANNNKGGYWLSNEKEMSLSERLTHTIEDKGEGLGTFRMFWEKLSVSLPFKTN